MPIRLTGLLCGAALLACAPAAVAADAFNVSIRVDGKNNKTIVKERTVTLADAPIIKDGNPEHSCSTQAAIGALNAGTGGAWTGTWYEGLGYTADTIKGVNPSPAYFELWVNHKLSSTGLCDTPLKAGDDVLLFIQDCKYVPALQGCRNPKTPLGVRVASRIKRNTVHTIKIVDYSAAGKATPSKGATVFVNGHKLGRTDKAGRIKVKGTKTGTATIYAIKQGNARSETDTVRIVK